MSEDQRYRWVGGSAALGGVALMLGGLSMPWVFSGLDSGEPSRGVDLVAVWLPTVGAALASIAFTLAWWWTRRAQLAVYAALCAGFLALLAATMLFALELSAGLIPLAFLPETVRRSAGVLSAGPGLWTSLAGAGAVVVATSGIGRWQFRRHSWARVEDRWKLAAVALLLGFLVLVGWLRYQPWIGSSALGQSLSVSGQAAPWVGPASLFGLWLLGGAVVLLVLARFQIAGLVAAAAGWLFSFLAATSVIAGESLARLRLDDLVGGSVSGQDLTSHAAIAAWGTYVCGVVLAGVGGCLVCWRRDLSGGN